MSQSKFLAFKDSNDAERLASSQTPLPVGGAGYVSTNTITRPANATAYTANDAIGIDDGAGAAGSAILTLASIGPTAGHVFITDVLLEVDLTAVPASMSTFTLHLYNASPTAILDNAAWDLPSGDRTKYLGSVAITTPVDLGSTLYSQNGGPLPINKKVKLAASSTSLYGILVTAGGYTPASGTVMVLTVHTIAV